MSDADAIFDLVSRRFPEAGVRCLMIGGHAVNHYGVTRATRDIDFMVSAADMDTVRQLLLSAGFTNTCEQDSVAFFNTPGSPLRVDFLKVDPPTMDALLEHAVAATYFDRHDVMLPRLEDLLAMKIFAMKTGGARREERDLPDVIHLILANGLDLDSVIEPICRRFGNAAILRKIRARVDSLQQDEAS